MDLLYIWIKEYKGLKNIGLNFSNQFKFTLESDFQLNISMVENYIPDFFGSNITNLTALIGENGSGKTSILRFMMDLVNDGSFYNRDKPFIAIYKDKSNFYFYSSILNMVTISENEIFEVKKIDFFKLTSTVIYASNSFDPTPSNKKDMLSSQIGEIENLSTSFLFFSTYRLNRDAKIFSNDIKFENRISAFATEEFIKMVKLLEWLNQKEKNRENFPVKPPPYLNIQIFRKDGSILHDLLTNFKLKLLNIFSSKNDIFIINSFIAGIQEIAEESFSHSNSEDIKTKINKLLDFIISDLENFKLIDNLYAAEFIFGTISNFLVIKETDLHGEYKIENDKNSITEKDSIKSGIKQLQIFLQNLNTFINAIKNDLVDLENLAFSLDLSQDVNNSLYDFIAAYNKAGNIANFMDFFFSYKPFSETSISSGEYAMLNLFARLNDLKLVNDQPILLLMDEAELALHPQWQKEFIHHFIDFINKRFSGHNVQIIITAHSPFILSDLPSNCVVLLKKENDKTVVVEKLENNQDTFGANIHELLTDSFFLRDGLMGEFARNKIDKLINEIKAEKSITKDEYDKKYKNRINIIGEPFIRSKINELVASKSEISVIDSIIEQRTDEIEILRLMKNKRKDDQNREY